MTANNTNAEPPRITPADIPDRYLEHSRACAAGPSQDGSGRWASGAVVADVMSVADTGVPVSVVDQVAAAAAEFVFSHGNDFRGQFIVDDINVRKLIRVG